MKVGVLGCGSVARAHLDALARLPLVEVDGVCDLDDERGSEVARTYGVERTYRQAADLFERVDAVHVLTPPQSHKSLSIQALEAGCHVLVEKPMALDLEEADEMVAAASRSGRTLGVCHNFLFDPAVVRALELLELGAFGQITGVEIFWRVWRGRPDRYASTLWMRDLPGRFFHESAPHLVYLQQAFLGQLRVVAATASSTPGQPWPSNELRALFAGDAGLGGICVSFSSSLYQLVLRIYGTEAGVQVDLVNHVLSSLDGGGPVRRLRAANDALLHPAHAGLIGRFYEALQAGGPPPVTAEDGRSVVAVLDRLWAVLEAPAPVEVEA